MPELRFAEFNEPWYETTLGKVSDCLDNMRIPIKEGDRSKKKGKYPYYGASGIIDYIDDKAFEKKIKRMVHQNYTHYSKKNQAKEIRRTIKRMKEARTYLARYLVTKELLQQNLAKQNKAKNQQAALPNHFSKWLAAKS